MIGHHYYNEFDPRAAAWLRELMAEGLIPAGEVDTRSITDVTPSDLHGFTQAHFFAGIGGWPLALQLAGWPADRPVWTGSCPCQPFSVAGRQMGGADSRHLFPTWRRLIARCAPPVVFGEQVGSPLGRQWLARVRSALGLLGYGVGAADLCAAGVGAPHIRQRLFWVADASGWRLGKPGSVSDSPWLAGSEFDGESCERLADTHGRNAGEGRQPRSGQHGREPQNRGTGRLGDSSRTGSGRYPGTISGAQGSGEAQGFDAGDLVDLPVSPSGGLVQPERTGLEGHAWHEHDGDQSGRLGADSSRPAPAAGGRPGRPWDSFQLLHCTDGKARRVPQSDFLGLAHGLSAELDHLRIAGDDHPLAAQKIPGRTGILRGYGNAIVPECAAQFVRAYLETKPVPLSATE